MNFLILLFTGFFMPQQAPQTLTYPRMDTTIIDTSRYAILPFNKNRDAFLFDAKYKPADLSAAEIEKIEKVVKIMVAEYNKKILEQKVNNLVDSPSTGGTIEEPAQYYKQMIAITNNKREKEVWVNCFCTPREKKYWRKGVIVILDGGTCFFNLKINLNTNTVMEFNVNGVS
jgi:hypothetical protein